MKLLLDTHTLVWALGDAERLTLRARTAIASASNDVYVSMASAWELAILEGLARIRLGAPLATVFTARLAALRIRLVPIQLQHLAALAGLPHHHRDPFDRLLVATALSEGMTLVSGDATIAAYDAAVLW